MIKYEKGEEPENIKKRIKTLFIKLDNAYPDKVIIGLHKSHKKWAETVTELYRLLGYESGNQFLEAYGYTIKRSDNKGGRPSNSRNVIQELKRRYQNGPQHYSIEELIDNNQDLKGEIKTLRNKSKEKFGMTFSNYLIKENIIRTKLYDEVEEVQTFQKLIDVLKSRRDKNELCSYLELKNINPDIDFDYIEGFIYKHYNQKPSIYFRDEGVLLSGEIYLQFVLHRLEKKYNRKALFSYLELKKENSDIDFDYIEEFIYKHYNEKSSIYFRDKGILLSGEIYLQFVLHRLEKKYNGKALFSYLELKQENSEIDFEYLEKYINLNYQKDALLFFVEKRILFDEASYFSSIIDELRKKYKKRKLISYTQLKQENSDVDFNYFEKYIKKHFSMTPPTYLRNEGVLELYVEEQPEFYLGEKDFINCKKQFSKFINSLPIFNTDIDDYNLLSQDNSMKRIANHRNVFNEFNIIFPVAGTRFEHRYKQIDKIEIGEKVILLREPNNIYNKNNITVLNQDNLSLGNLSAMLCNALAPLLDNGYANIKDSRSFYKVCNHRNPILYLNIIIEIKPIIDISSSVVVYEKDLEGSVVKSTLFNTLIPFESMKEIFNIYNEYDYSIYFIDYLKNNLKENILNSILEEDKNTINNKSFNIVDLFSSVAINESTMYIAAGKEYQTTNIEKNNCNFKEKTAFLIDGDCEYETFIKSMDNLDKITLNLSSSQKRNMAKNQINYIFNIYGNEPNAAFFNNEGKLLFEYKEEVIGFVGNSSTISYLTDDVNIEYWKNELDNVKEDYNNLFKELNLSLEISSFNDYKNRNKYFGQYSAELCIIVKNKSVWQKFRENIFEYDISSSSNYMVSEKVYVCDSFLSLTEQNLLTYIIKFSKILKDDGFIIAQTHNINVDPYLFCCTYFGNKIKTLYLSNEELEDIDYDCISVSNYEKWIQDICIGYGLDDIPNYARKLINDIGLDIIYE